MDWQELEPLQPEEISVDAVLLPQDAMCWGSSPDLCLAVTNDCLSQIKEHAVSSSNEVLGVLRGRVITDGERTLTIAVRAEPLRSAQGSRVSVRATLETWQQAWSTMQDELVVVGWYHSHPGLGVFFSETDHACQRRFFQQAWQVGVVVDPVTGEAGVYRGPQSEPVTWITVDALRSGGL